MHRGSRIGPYPNGVAPVGNSALTVESDQGDAMQIPMRQRLRRTSDPTGRPVEPQQGCENAGQAHGGSQKVERRQLQFAGSMCRHPFAHQVQARQASRGPSDVAARLQRCRCLPPFRV